MQRYLIITLILVLGGITFGTPFFLKKGDSGMSGDERMRLKEENQDLLAQLQRMQVAYGEADKYKEEALISAKIFSDYPFNIKNKLTVNVGSEEGISPAMTATIGENILIGYIKEVARHASGIETMFDPSLQLPVRMGTNEVDGMLQGGTEPRVVLIEKAKAIQVGDIVYAAGAGMPYGLKIGEITEIQDAPGSVFREAIIKLPYSINELREVKIRLTHQ